MDVPISSRCILSAISKFEYTNRLKVERQGFFTHMEADKKNNTRRKNFTFAMFNILTELTMAICHGEFFENVDGCSVADFQSSKGWGLQH